MLTDLKVLETGNKDDERTVEKIKGVSLIGKESRCICRQCVSEDQISSAGENSLFFLGFCLSLRWCPGM